MSVAGRSGALAAALTCLALVVPGSGAAAADSITTHDPGLVLFVDDRAIERREGLDRIFNKAEPLPAPVIAPDHPATEADCAWGSVIREPDGRFRMWYCTLMMGHAGKGPHEMAAAGVWGQGEEFAFHPRSPADVRPTETMLGRYAESDDGIAWRKPELGLVEFRGSRANNVCLDGSIAAAASAGLLTNFDGWSVLRDDREPDPRRRYKAVAHWESVHCWDNHAVSGSLGRPQAIIDRHWEARGEYLLASPDGLHWEGPPERLDSLPSGGGDRLVVVPDPGRDGWMAYVRSGGWAHPALARSADLVTWGAPEAARRITPEVLGFPAVECMIPFAYGALDLAFPCGMDKQAGRFSVRLAIRDEAGEWELCDDGEPFIPAGPPGSHHASGAVPLHNEPFVVGDSMLVFYNAFSRDPDHPCPEGARSIGVARLRRDGFVGLAPSPGRPSGTLLTAPLPPGATRLAVNVQRRDGPGDPLPLRAALVGSDGEPLPGRALSDCDPITGDGTRIALSWRGEADLPAGASEVRLFVEIPAGAVIYAVATASDTTPAGESAAPGTAGDP